MRQKPLDFYAALVTCAAILAAIAAPYWWDGRLALFFSGDGDNRDIFIPLSLYFLEGLREGTLQTYNPYLWGGSRLLGNPNFQLTPFHALIGLLFDRQTFIEFMSVWTFVELLLALIGFSVLARRLWRDQPPWIWPLAGLLYVCSSGVAIAGAFPSTSFHFAALPWACWLLLHMVEPGRKGAIIAILIVVMWLQFSYGQLQFSVYFGWITIAFALGVLPRKDRLKGVVALVACALAGGLLSAYYLVPMIETVLLSGDRGVGGGLDDAYQRVPWFYVVRLLLPDLFTEPGIGWWPVWRDGWSTWESYSAYQGALVTLTAVFGLFLRSVPWFWRLGYVFLVVAPCTRVGVQFLYVANLGTGVPYGRLTVLIGFFAVPIIIYVLAAAMQSDRVRIGYLGFLVVALVGLWALTRLGFVEVLVNLAYAKAHTVPGDFYVRNQETLHSVIDRHFVLVALAVAVLLAWAWIAATRVHKLATWYQRHSTVLAAAFLTAIALDAVFYFERALPDAQHGGEELAILLPHPIERTLLRSPDSTPGQRLLVNLGFAKQRILANESGYATKSSDGSENLYRVAPNNPMLFRQSITSGYSSIIPQNLQMSRLVQWSDTPGPTFRALGGPVRLHPFLLDAFAVSHVLTLQPEAAAALSARTWQDPVDPWENYFRAHSRVVYSDEVLELRQYTDRVDVFLVPARVGFADRTIGAIDTLFDPTLPWKPTVVLPRNAASRAGFAGDRTPMGTFGGGTGGPSVDLFEQKGRVVDFARKPGLWARVTVEAAGATYLYASLARDPWWHASVDGRDVPIERANEVFSAVLVPPGRHTVHFKLRPTSVYVGIGLSCLTTLLLVLALAISLWRNRRSTTLTSDGFAALRSRPGCGRMYCQRE